MNNKLDLYRIFWMVEQNKSFSKAAKSLYMTQPAVSQAIKQLERDLDTCLFTRTPRGVSLTDEGRLLYEYVHSAISLLGTGEEKMLQFKNLAAGELKIGVGDTISKYFLLSYLETFHNRFPNIKCKIINGTTNEICAMLKSTEVDIGVCNFPIEDAELQLIPCFNVQDIFVCGEKYKRILSKSLHLHELVRMPLIFLERKSNSRNYVEEYFLSKGIKLSPEFELGSHDLLLEFAKINMGIACVTKEFSLEYLNKGQVFEVKLIEKIPKRSIGLCSLKSVPLTQAASKFVEIVTNA